MIAAIKRRFTSDGLGQSLAETALFLPILILLIAGVVEISNLLNTKNRVVTASRIGAGFGASNFDPESWPDTADAIGRVTYNTVTETLDLDLDLWDIWAVHAIVDNTGLAFRVFTSTHVLGNYTVVPSSTWPALENEIRTDMLAELQSTGIESAKNLEVVASVPYHNIDNILGIPLWRWTGLKTVRGLTVMRIGQKGLANGCVILPITIKDIQWSIYPSNWDPDTILPESFAKYGSNAPFPDSDPGDNDHELIMPTPNPPGSTQNVYPRYDHAYTDTFFSVVEPINPPNFPKNKPGFLLTDWIYKGGGKGFLFLAREQEDAADPTPGGFGWLSWSGSTSQQSAQESLTWPGNFRVELSPGYPDPAYTDDYPGSRADLGLIDNTGCGAPLLDDPPNPDPCTTGDGDGDLEIGEWVEVATGNKNKLRDEINNYVRPCDPDDPSCWQDVSPTLLVFDYHHGTGANINYRVAAFVTVQIWGAKFSGNEKWILFEYIKTGSDCLPPVQPAS